MCEMAVNIMIQGTMSNAGKSLIAAGLCRVFAQDGYEVAPFKSQNMALNSYVTEEGLEMGRAQVVQAEACGKQPSVLMNPILLKPTTDVGSQVVVMGKVRSNMKASDYFKYKKSLIPEIMEAYRRLEEENDIIVIEGAGSPAEINLKADDIVNMGLAKLVDAPVLLVGDIDRGGVFAQLAGTVMLLEEEEKERIRGMIINKFRGDVSILEPGLKMIEEICDKPVIGVVPYERLDIDDEDSLSERLEYKGNYRKNEASDALLCAKDADGEENEKGCIDIAVIRLPKISNFTDFAALEAAEGARVRYADAPSELASADIIVLPGTKSTMSDLEWLRRTGLAAEIVRRGRSGALVIGICGGYQMLGNTITDRTGCESEHPHTAAALGLLPVNTVFQEEKTLGLTCGAIAEISGAFARLSGLSVSGYEIHMGTSEIDADYSDQCRPFILLERKNDPERNARFGEEMTVECAGGRMLDFTEGEESEITGSKELKCIGSEEEKYTDGCVFGNIMGTYLHGIFDSSAFTEALLAVAAEKKGLDQKSFRVPDRRKYKEEQYDKLAQIIRSSLDMKKIYEIMGISPEK